MLLGGGTLEPLVFLTKKIKPDIVYYITSKDLKVLNTFRQYKGLFEESLKEIKLYSLDEPLFDTVYQAMIRIDKESRFRKYYVGITGGKKTMALAAALFAYQHKRKYEILYTDFKQLDPIRNAPKENSKVFLVRINFDNPILLTMDPTIRTNNIYIFKEENYYSVFIQNKNLRYKINKSEIKTLFTVITHTHDIDRLSDYIIKSFKFDVYKYIFETEFNLYLDESLIDIPFEIISFFDKLLRINVINNNIKPDIQKENFMTILYDKEYPLSLNEAELIAKISESNKIPYVLLARQNLQYDSFLSYFEKAKYFHYIGHIDREGIRIKNGFINSNMIKMVKEPPKFVFFNGCQALSGTLLKGIIESDIKIALGPIIPIPEKIPYKDTVILYKEIINNHDYFESVKKFVRKMRKLNYYYRVYYG